MRRLGRTWLAAPLLLAACGSSTPSPMPGAPVTVTGQLVLVQPSAPEIPATGVIVSVIDPVAAPVVTTRSDARGSFTLTTARNGAGRVRLFVNGMTAVGGPFVTWNIEYGTSGATLDVGTIRLVTMEANLITPITSDVADLSTTPDGRTRAVLRSALPLSGGTTEPGISAGLTLPAGSSLTFPPTAPLIVNMTRIPIEALPAPLPTASDGSPRFSQYAVSLQPAGLELGAPVALQLPEVDGALPGSAVEIWQADASNRRFDLKGPGQVQLIPVRQPAVPFAVTNQPPIVNRFEVFAAMPTCRAQTTTIVGRTVDVAQQPVASAEVTAFGQIAKSDANGAFRIPNVALGCNMPTPFTLLASLKRPNGVLLSGGAGMQMPITGGETQIGDVTLSTPFYVVRARPTNGLSGGVLTGVPLNTAFDVYFSEPIDPATIDNVTMERFSLGQSGMCEGSAVVGKAILDARDPTHVRFVPERDLDPGSLYRGIVVTPGAQSAGNRPLTSPFQSIFVTVVPSDRSPPQVSPTRPSGGSSFVSGSSLIAEAHTSDDSAVTRGRWQLCPSTGNGCSNTCVAEGAATLVSADPCIPYHQARLSARITLPTVTSRTEYCLQLFARDPAGNEGSSSTRILVVGAGNYFPFCGTAQSQTYISTNGVLTFDGPELDFTPTTEEFFARGRIAAFFADVDLRPNGRVFTNLVPGDDPGFAITWFETGMYAAKPGPNTFQIVLFRGGAIQLRYGGISDVLSDKVFSGSNTAAARSYFMGLSCPGASLGTPPAPDSLLVPKDPQTFTETTRSPWSGDPIYDFITVPDDETETTRISQGFANRLFNFVPPGQPPKPPVGVFTDGTAVDFGNSLDDNAVAVPIEFQATTPDAGFDAATLPDAGVDAMVDAEVVLN